MLRFEEGLASYIRNQLVEQHIQTSQELYERVVEIKRVKTKLRMGHQANPKRRWNEKSAHVEGVLSKNLSTLDQGSKAKPLSEALY